MSAPSYTQPGTTVPGDAPGSPSTIAPISRVEYTALKSKAMRTGDAAQVALLEARAKHTIANKPELWRTVWGKR
jgi:hypothetical protein